MCHLMHIGVKIKVEPSVRRDEMQEEQKACFHLHSYKTNLEITSEQIF